jgi:hypothetical protein
VLSAPDRGNRIERAIIDFSRAGLADGDAVMSVICVLHSDGVRSFPTLARP